MLDQKRNGESGASMNGLNRAHMTHCLAGSKPLALLGRSVGQGACEVSTQKLPRPAPVLGQSVGQPPARLAAISPAAEWMQAAAIRSQGD